MKAQNFSLLAVLLAIFWIAGGVAASAAQPTPSAEEIAELRVKAERGDASAQNRLGVALDLGRGVEKDEVEAAKWYRKAGEQGDSYAQSNLGAAYANGRGVPKDDTEAMKWWLKAAEQGHARSQFHVGLSYAEGKGAPKDEAEAVRWYRKAAEQGDSWAQFNLGSAYLAGRGVPKDDAEVTKWYRHAAEQGLPAAQYMAGVRYARGEGVLKNEAEAYKWLLLAGAQGVEDARKQYEILERTLLPTDRAEGQRMAREFVPRKGPPLPARPQAATTSTTQVGDMSQPRPSTDVFYWDWAVVAGLCVMSLPILLLVHLWQRRKGKSATIAITPASGTGSGQTPMPSVYVLMAGNQRGPFTADQALDMVRQGQLLGETPAWKEGLADWTRLDQVLNQTLAVPAASPPPPQLAPNPPVSRGHKTFTLTQPVTGARPGLRFLARFTDLILFSNCMYLIGALATPTLLPADVNTRAALFAFLWCFVEAGLLSTWGMTPGKALLKIHVRNANGSLLSYFDALARSFDVWFRGLGMVLPVISLITLTVGYNKLATKGTTSWDEKGNYQVTHGTVGPVHITVAIVVIVLAFVFGVADSLASKGAGGR